MLDGRFDQHFLEIFARKADQADEEELPPEATSDAAGIAVLVLALFLLVLGVSA